MNKTPITIDSEEKLVPIMIYTHHRLIWGKLIVKNIIRVSTLLQTDVAPKCLDLTEAQVILFGAGSDTKSLKFPLLHVEIDQIIAYHILPPADESPYYEENEQNRIMQPVTTIVGIFQFSGSIRISQQSNLKTYLGVQKGTFLPIFNATMTCPLIPSIKGVRSPFTLIRQGAAIFSGHSN